MYARVTLAHRDMQPECSCAAPPGVSAKDWVNEALQVCGGKGGGKPGRAQGAARDPTNVAAAEAAAKQYAGAKLSIEIS